MATMDEIYNPASDMGYGQPMEAMPKPGGIMRAADIYFNNSPSLSVMAGANSFRAYNTLMRGGYQEGKVKSLWQIKRKTGKIWDKVPGLRDAPTQNFGYYQRFMDSFRTRFSDVGVLNDEPYVNLPSAAGGAANAAAGFVTKHSSAARSMLMRHGLADAAEFEKDGGFRLFEHGVGAKMRYANTVDKLMSKGKALPASYEKLLGASSRIKQGLSVTGEAGFGLTFANPAAASDIMKAGTTSAFTKGDLTLVGSRGITGRFTGGFKIGQRMFSSTAISAAEVDAATAGLRVGGVAAQTGAKLAGNLIGKEAMYAAGEQGLKKVGVTLAKTAAEEGIKSAAKVGAGYAARGAMVAGEIMSGPVGWALMAWQAYDLAKTGTKLFSEFVINPTAKLISDGYKSAKGSIDKSPFGMGYKDNEIAMTSRARGVQAIQASRLNARSVLGSEAGMMSNHFG